MHVKHNHYSCIPTGFTNVDGVCLMYIEEQGYSMQVEMISVSARDIGVYKHKTYRTESICVFLTINYNEQLCSCTVIFSISL